MASDRSRPGLRKCAPHRPRALTRPPRTPTDHGATVRRTGSRRCDVARAGFLGKTRVLSTEDQDPLRARVAQALGLAGPQKVQRVTLPVMDEQLEPVPEARKALLSSNIDAEFAARKDRTRVPKTPTPLDDASVLAVCGTCRGACCKWGEDHAYLTRAVLSRVKMTLRIASDEALLQRYLDKVPAQARKGSCVYHGAEGCALPRSMRSETCNRFVCHPLKQLGQDFGRPGYAQLAVSRGADRADRMLLLSEGETRPLCPED